MREEEAMAIIKVLGIAIAIVILLIVLVVSIDALYKTLIKIIKDEDK